MQDHKRLETGLALICAEYPPQRRAVECASVARVLLCRERSAAKPTGRSRSWPQARGEKTGPAFHRPSCFGFGLDLADKSLTARGFAGSVVSSRPITNLRGLGL